MRWAAMPTARPFSITDLDRCCEENELDALLLAFVDFMRGGRHFLSGAPVHYGDFGRTLAQRRARRVGRREPAADYHNPLAGINALTPN